MSVNRASEVWKEIKPFAIRDMNRMLDNKAGDSGDDLYAIILYDESAQKIKYYSMSAEGLISALAASDSGDSIFVPPGTISGILSDTVYATLTTNTKALSLGSGNSGNDPPEGWNTLEYDDSSWGYATLASDPYVIVDPGVALWMAVPKNYRCVFRHKFTPSILATQAILTWDADDWTNGIYVNGVLVDQWLNSVAGDDHPPRDVDISEYINFGSENVICIDQYDADANAPNACSISWKITVNSNDTITIPSGVEIVGLGKNSILEANVVNEGILTNISVTGTISGAGDIRLVPNPTIEVFSNQIKSIVSSGSSPLLISSTTVVDNLNADMVDGKHASELTNAESIDGIDVDLTGITDGEVLVYDSYEDKLVPGEGGGGASAISELTDVDLTGLADGDVLVFDETSGEWLPETPSGGGGVLDDLTDVVITSASNGEVLTYDSGSSEWKNSVPATPPASVPPSLKIITNRSFI